MSFTKKTLIASMKKEPTPPKSFKLAFINNFLDEKGYNFDVNNVLRLLELEMIRVEQGKDPASTEDIIRFLHNKATVDKIPFWLMPYIVEHAYYLLENNERAWENKEWLFKDLKDKISKEKDIEMTVP